MSQNVDCQNIRFLIKNILKNRNVSMHFHLMTPREKLVRFIVIWKQMLNAENMKPRTFIINSSEKCSETE